MKNSSYYISPVGDRTHDLPHTVASNMVKVAHALNHSATEAVIYFGHVSKLMQYNQQMTFLLRCLAANFNRSYGNDVTVGAIHIRPLCSLKSKCSFSQNQNQNQKCFYSILTKSIYKVTMKRFWIRGPLLRPAWSLT